MNHVLFRFIERANSIWHLNPYHVRRRTITYRRFEDEILLRAEWNERGRKER